MHFDATTCGPSAKLVAMEGKRRVSRWFLGLTGMAARPSSGGLDSGGQFFAGQQLGVPHESAEE